MYIILIETEHSITTVTERYYKQALKFAKEQAQNNPNVIKVSLLKHSCSFIPFIKVKKTTVEEAYGKPKIEFSVPVLSTSGS